MTDITPETALLARDIAVELRALREAGGNPTLEALARRTGVSKTVLSDALAGKKLPTERTIVAVATAFGADPTGLVARRREAEPEPGQPVQPAAARRGFGIRTLLAVAAAALVVGGGLGAAGTWAIGRTAGAPSAAPSRPAAAAASNAPRVAVTPGEDPADTPCVDDAKVVASQTETHDTQLQIIYSNACHAAWSRINRYDGKALGNEISTSIYRQIAPQAKDRQSTTEPDIQSAYTTLIVRPSPETTICAVGSITLDGQSIPLQTPVCL